MPRLSAKSMRLVRDRILDSAAAMLESNTAADLSLRAIAEHAGTSERTLYRYFLTRETLLEELAGLLIERLALPSDEGPVRELVTMPRRLYTRFEAHPRIVQVLLDAEPFRRVLQARSEGQRAGIHRALENTFPDALQRDREIACANLHLLLSAATWHHYRYVLALDRETAIECAEALMRQTLTGLAVCRT